LSLNKEMAKENQPGRSLRDLPGIAALQKSRRERHLSFSRIARRLATTRGRQRKQKRLLSVLLKTSSITRRVADGKSFCFCGVRVTSVLSFLLKTTTQKLNIYPFAKR